MDPSETTPVLRELQARDAYCLDRSGMWMAIREVWEDMADDEIAVLHELWGPHCPDDVVGCLVMRFCEEHPAQLAVPLSRAEYEKWDAAAQAVEVMVSPSSDETSAR